MILELYKVHIDSIGSGVWLYSFAILTDPHVPTKRIYWCTPWPHWVDINTKVELGILVEYLKSIASTYNIKFILVTGDLTAQLFLSC